jgi:hypothetical protein
MFDDILGEHREKILNTGSVGDTKSESFAEIWTENQQKIDNLYEDELEDLQLDDIEL